MPAIDDTTALYAMNEINETTAINAMPAINNTTIFYTMKAMDNGTTLNDSNIEEIVRVKKTRNLNGNIIRK